MRRSGLAIVALLGLTLAAGCATPEPTAPAALAPASDPGATSYNLSAGPYEGSFALRFAITPEERTACNLTLRLTGVSREGALVGAYAVGSGEDVLDEVFLSTQSSLGAQAGVEGAGANESVDTRGPQRWLETRDAEWGLQYEAAPDAPLWLLLVARDVRPVGDESGLFADAAREVLGNASAAVGIDCAAPFTVGTFEGSRSVALFSERDLAGTGAYARAVFDDTAAHVRSSVQLGVTEPQGILSFRVGGDLFLNHVSAGAFEVTTPSKEETFVDYPTQVLVHLVAGLPFLEARYVDGPGAYRIDATWASAESMGMLEGYICGLAPLQTPEDLWA